MHIERENLPGVGARYTVHTRHGALLGVIRRRDGQRGLVFYRPGDPDSAEGSVTLTGQEAQEVAELLYTVHTVDHLASLERQIEGIPLAATQVNATSPFHRRAVGELALQAQPGVCVIAVLRDGQRFAAPEPGFVLAGGDTVIAAGTGEGLGRLSTLLDPGQP